ncbi:efflux RND transporter periplasmic adaptor subunit [Cupriavidus sp. 30B13]|uniref:efflux RND transporter periplasmic adaptor subunit n=1 Tax=Cupriavidus sp. 30B13 TaxID=3384241 RepID=UPI003B90F556
MNDDITRLDAGSSASQASRRKGTTLWVGSIAAAAVVVAGGALTLYTGGSNKVQAAPTKAPIVSVSSPLQRDIETRIGFLGQFSPVKNVELRAQVGGTLKQINFKDGDIIREGDVLFVIDPEPYEITLAKAQAQLESATARLELAGRELTRAETLKNTDAGTQQNVEQRLAEKRAAQAAVNDAKAQIRDARFDLERTRVKAPFTGRIGTHQVSAGNIIAGSRAANGPTTLLATIVSMDPIYLNFDMSEADYMRFQQQRAKEKGPLANKIELSLNGESKYDRQGTLDFLDNTLDRSSGTIHARATIRNPDLVLTPGGFARIRLAVTTPEPTLLVPDASVMADQSEHIVLTVGKDNVVTPKKVEIGDLRGGLRVVRSGLAATDQVVIDGVPFAAPGSKVAPKPGSITFAEQD